MAEDRCDFLFSTGEYRENVRDNWGGLFDLIENHVDNAAAEENISTRTASGGGGSGLGSSGRDNSGGDIGSALDAAVVAVGELAEDLLHNDKKTEDDEEESVEEPMQVQRKISRKAGPVPSEDWESGPASSSSREGERISTHSRRRHRVRRHRRKRKGNLPAFVERRRILPSGRSDAGRSPAGRGRRDRQHETRPRGSPDSRSRGVGGSR